MFGKGSCQTCQWTQSAGRIAINKDKKNHAFAFPQAAQKVDIRLPFSKE